MFAGSAKDLQKIREIATGFAGFASRFAKLAEGSAKPARILRIFGKFLQICHLKFKIFADFRHLNSNIFRFAKPVAKEKYLVLRKAGVQACV
jgi:hypothetical protein